MLKEDYPRQKKEANIKKRINVLGYEIIAELNTGGSQRRFYRARKRNSTYVIIYDQDKDSYLRIQKHLSRKGIGVPKVYDVQKNLIVTEDLGEDSLYELKRRKNENIKRYYQKAIQELVKLQVDGRQGVPVKSCYDAKHIKWEQDYFEQYFLGQLCHQSQKRIDAVKNDFAKLRTAVLSAIQPLHDFLMHRDYQSQNIFVKDNRIRIIDFQSARIGPLSYDLAALLRDSYSKIAEPVEEELVDFYLKCVRRKGIQISNKEFLKAYCLTGIQRNMQALGAFANLSLNKGKPGFRKYIPRGLELLKRGLWGSDFNELFMVVRSIG